MLRCLLQRHSAWCPRDAWGREGIPAPRTRHYYGGLHPSLQRGPRHLRWQRHEGLHWLRCSLHSQVLHAPVLHPEGQAPHCFRALPHSPGHRLRLPCQAPWLEAAPAAKAGLAIRIPLGRAPSFLTGENETSAAGNSASSLASVASVEEMLFLPEALGAGEKSGGSLQTKAALSQ